MALTSAAPPTLLGADDARGRFGDSFFRVLTLASGVLIFVILALVSLYLLLQSLPALTASPEALSTGTSYAQYVLPLALGTLLCALIAIALSTPVSIAVALFISHYAPARLSKPVGYVIDILAAIPSVVFGAWGMTTFGPGLVPFYEWLSKACAPIPGLNAVFGTASTTGRTLLTASIVLAIMILPIVTSQCREIFIQTPRLHEEAALALGSTKWDMIKATVFPFARNGIVSAVMLGLGRALGETMAVTLVLAPGALTLNLIGVGNKTIPAEIALNYPEAFGMRQSELIAAGLILFVITLVINMIARWIVSRYAEFSGAN